MARNFFDWWDDRFQKSINEMSYTEPVKETFKAFTDEVKRISEEAYNVGYDHGHEDGYKDGITGS